MANYRHYSYRVDHDLGFAPHVSRGNCTVCGCKSTTIEQWMENGGWVVGTGGKGTEKTDMLIYAMRVGGTPTYSQFRADSPSRAAYLGEHGIDPQAKVFVSDHFYYFGDNAQPIPEKLAHIIQPTQGCKGLYDADIELLHQLILSKFEPGVHGKPNNGSGISCGVC